MPRPKILYVLDRLAVVRLVTGVFVVRLEPRLPQIFDSYANKLIIGNFDSWVLNATANYCDYNDLVAMAEFWLDGYNSAGDLQFDIDRLVLKIKDLIFKSDIASQYAEDYWIECTPQDKIVPRIINPITQKSDLMVQRLGFKTVAAYLGRVREVLKNRPQIDQVNNLLKTLDLHDLDIEYPETKELDDLLVKKVKKELAHRDPNAQYKVLIENCRKCLI
jgi:hypothetical protein